MEHYHHYRSMVKEQMKGHFVFLYGWTLLISIIIAILQNVGAFLGDSLFAALVSLGLSLLCVIINTTVLFLFLQRVRGIRFRKENIRYSFSKGGIQILIGLLLSLIQLMVQIVAGVLMAMPILYMLVTAFLNLFFVCWYALIAYLIYDQDCTVSALIKKPLAIMKTNLSSLFLAGGFYILWNIISQIALSTLLQTYLKESETLEQAMAALVKEAGVHTEFLWIMLGCALVYFLVQYLILTVLHLFLANLYEHERQLA